MATERQSPDVILELANLTPNNVAYIQDDPDAPDGNWLTAIANNTASICRTSFPTPTGNPTQGAGLQEFKCWVRKMGGTGTPTAWLELYEDGWLITAGTPVDITNLVGQMITLSWDAALLGTPDGSLVECRLNSTAVGGSPSGRATIEDGAVEWNVDYSTGTTHTGAGTAALNLSSTAAGQKVLLGAGTSALALDTTGAGVATLVGAGTSALSLDTTGAGMKVLNGAGTATLTIDTAGAGQTVLYGSATALLELTTSGDALKVLLGAGTSALTLDTTATAQGVFVGAGTALLTVDTYGDGQLVPGGGTVHEGAGTASLTINTTAAGLKTLFGAGTATLTISTAGAGQKILYGSGSALLELLATGAAQGIFAGAGTATLTISTTASALSYSTYRHPASLKRMHRWGFKQWRWRGR